mmetsp:Transcript_52804/g.105794  ORF Transcript_52804/g.105794 Transcript_52804/m.105794 type:complete len:354 (+) Transcript_52804:763-1824(+)
MHARASWSCRSRKCRSASPRSCGKASKSNMAADQVGTSVELELASFPFPNPLPNNPPPPAPDAESLLPVRGCWLRNALSRGSSQHSSSTHASSPSANTPASTSKRMRFSLAALRRAVEATPSLSASRRLMRCRAAMVLKSLALSSAGLVFSSSGAAFPFLPLPPRWWPAGLSSLNRLMNVLNSSSSNAINFWSSSMLVAVLPPWGSIASALPPPTLPPRGDDGDDDDGRVDKDKEEGWGATVPGGAAVSAKKCAIWAGTPDKISGRMGAGVDHISDCAAASSSSPTWFLSGGASPFPTADADPLPLPAEQPPATPLTPWPVGVVGTGGGSSGGSSITIPGLAARYATGSKNAS